MPVALSSPADSEPDWHDWALSNPRKGHTMADDSTPYSPVGRSTRNDHVRITKTSQHPRYGGRGPVPDSLTPRPAPAADIPTATHPTPTAPAQPWWRRALHDGAGRHRAPRLKAQSTPGATRGATCR